MAQKNRSSNEYEFKGGSGNGFLALLIDLIIFGLAVYLVYYAIDNQIGCAAWCGALCLVIAIFVACGFIKQEPNEASVLTFFGKYSGTFRSTGFYWVNPLMSRKRVSLRARNLNPEPIKVNDKSGNPILIGVVVVWRLKDTYKAIFDIDTDVSTIVTANAANARMNKFENFVSVQSDSALREVAGMYSYDNEDTQDSSVITLRSGASEINDVLSNKLNERLEMAGLEVIEARINYLAYAPEIAAVMLRRQQAVAIITAREKIVEGAVSMVKLALDKLSSDGVVDLDEEKKAAMVSNLLVVLCADEQAQPVVNAGTLNH